MLFSSPFRSSSDLVEGFVSDVSPSTYSCTVVSVSNQYLRDVTWGIPIGGNSNSGVSWCPSVGDKVLVCTGLTSPTILCSLPRMGIPDGTQPSISGGPLGVDVTDSGTLKNGNTLNPGKPSDFSQDDKVIYSKGGGLFAVLGSGGIIAKASHVAQIFMSKFDGLVRIVGRNFYRFSDSSSDVSANVKGRLYHWFGVDKNISRGLTNSERYNEAYGDVATAESMRGRPSALNSIPAADSRLKKIWLNNSDGFSVMVETMLDDGSTTILIRSDDASSSATITHNKGQINLDVRAPGGFSTINVVPSQIHMDHNGTSIVTLSDSSTLCKYGDHQMLIDDTGVHLS